MKEIARLLLSLIMLVVVVPGLAGAIVIGCFGKRRPGRK